MLLLITPNLGEWFALIALNVTVIGLSSLAEKRTVIGIEYGKYLIDNYKVFGCIKIYNVLAAIAVINAVSLIVALLGDSWPIFSMIVFFLLLGSSFFVLYYLFAYVLRIHPAVKKEIYRKQMLGLYYDSDTPCNFDGDRVIGMPTGDRTNKKITSSVQSFFDKFDEESIAAFHDVFGPFSPIYSRSRKVIKECKRLGYDKPHNYWVQKDGGGSAGVVHISWEFFQMFRFSAIQDRWLLEILSIFNGAYANPYPRLRLYNVAVVFGQINRVGFAEGLYRYKFLDYMMPYVVRALDPNGDSDSPKRVEVESYFHKEFGKFIHDTMLHHPASTFTESAKKALGQMICIDRFRGVIPVKERIDLYLEGNDLGEYRSIVEEAVSNWKAETAGIKNIVFDFGNVLVGWDPDNLYGKDGKNCFSSPRRYQKFRKEVLTQQWLRELDSTVDMTEMIERRCKEFPSFEKALRLYKDRWMDTLSSEIKGMSELIRQLPDNIRVLGLSNWCSSTFEEARKTYPILNQIKEFIISGGLMDDDNNPVPAKPDPMIFQLFFRKFDVKPEECLFIDDNYDNVKTARLMQMPSHWFLNAKNLRMALEPVLNQ